MHLRPLQRAALSFVVLLLSVSCGDAITGPIRGNVSAPIVFRPQFLGDPSQSSLASGLDVASVRVVLTRTDSARSIVIDRVLTYATTDSMVTVPLEVPLASAAPEGEPFVLTLAYASPAGDTIFRGGPAVVIARPLGAPGAETPNEIETRYTGPGAQAVRVQLSPDSIEVLGGGNFAIIATAFDAQGVVVSNAPIRIATPDTNLLTLTAGASGIARNIRGVGRVVATILTGTPDTARVSVRLGASVAQPFSGGAQSGTVGAPLANPIVVRVTAADGLPVAGVAVSFTPSAGSGTTSVVTTETDANGDASTVWTLGELAGAQTLVASAAGIASPVSFTATATAASATRLVISAAPTSGTAVIGLSPTLVRAEDQYGNLATSFARAVTLQLFSNPGDATLGGLTTQQALGGLATFGGITVNRVGSGYQFVATTVDSGSVLTSAPSAPFNITAGPAVALEFVGAPNSAMTGVVIAPAVVVGAIDAAGNAATSFNDAITVGFGANPGSATLGGTKTVAAVAGLATFDNLSISADGIGYTLVASATGLSSVTSPAFSTTPAVLQWINASGGSWWTPANWDAGRVPTSTDSVFITLDGTYTVTIDSMAPVRSLVLGGASGTQTVQMIQNVGRTSVLNAANLVIGANAELQLMEVSQFGATAVQLEGNLLLAGITQLNSPVITGPTSRIRVVGGAFGAANANPIFSQPLVNHGTIELVAAPGTFAQIVANNAGVENRGTGTIRATGEGGIQNIVGRFVNDGVMLVSGQLGLLSPGFAIRNEGSITLNAGQLGVNLGNGSVPGDDGTFTNVGVITGDTTSNVRFDFGTVVMAAAGSIAGIEGVSLFSTNATLEHALSPSLNVNSSVVTLSAPLQMDNLAIFNSTVNGSGTITVGTGQFLMVQNTTLNTSLALTGGRLTVLGTSTLNAALTVEPNSVLGVDGAASLTPASLTVATGFVNRGIVSLVSDLGRNATLVVTEGTLVNESGSAIFAAGGAGVNTIVAPLDNRGNIFANIDLIVSPGGGPLVNSGLMRAITGSITVSGADVSNAGTINVDSSQWFWAEGGSFTNEATGVLGGAGTVNLIDVAATLDGSVAVNLVTSGSTITALQVIDIPLMNLNESSVSGAAVRVGAGHMLVLTNSELASPLQNEGQVSMSGAVSLSGPVSTVAGAQTIVIGGYLAGSATVVTVAESFTNHGAISLVSSSEFSATLNLGADSLVNEVGGSILSSGSEGLASARATIAATLVNRGQVSTDTPLLVESVAGSQASSGGLHVRGGTLEFHQTGITEGIALSGVVIVDSAATLVINAGLLDLSSATEISGAGTLSLTSANAIIAADIGTRFSSFFGSISLTGTLRAPSLSINSSGIGGTGVIEVPVGATATLSGIASVGIPLTLGGTLILAGTPTLSGPITAGSTSHVRVVGGAFGSTNTSATFQSAFANTGLLELEGVGSATAQLSITAGGAFLNASGGTVRTLGSGLRAITASTIENQGTLSLSPGIGGDTLQLNGDFVGGAVSSLLLDVGTGGADRLTVNGQASVAGSLTLTGLAGFTPPPASSYTLITASGGRVGTFGTVTLPPVFNPNVVYDASTVTVTTP